MGEAEQTEKIETTEIVEEPRESGLTETPQSSFALEPEEASKAVMDKKWIAIALVAVVLVIVGIVAGMSLAQPKAAESSGNVAAAANQQSTANTNTENVANAANASNSNANTNSNASAASANANESASNQAANESAANKAEGSSDASSGKKEESSNTSNEAAAQDSKAAEGDSSRAENTTPAADSQPTPEPEATPQPEPAPAPSTITVSIYIDSSRAPGYGDCMAAETVTLPVGSSVFDALCATGVSVGGGSNYVSSINGLAEKLPGYEMGSGWMYAVDGSFPGTSCGRYTLSGGESILWVYTLDMGNDV